MNFCQEDAASILFGTAEPTAQEIGRAYVLARALEANPDAWTLEELRAAHLLAALAGSDYNGRTLAHYLETARSFAYPLNDSDRLVVVRLGRTVISATVLGVESLETFVTRLSINFTELAPRVRKSSITITVIAGSPDVEFHALQEAA